MVRRSRNGRCRLGANIPAAAERVDQLHARGHLFHLQIQRRALIAQQSRLSGDDVQVAVHAELVTGHGEIEIALRRGDGVGLLLQFLRQNSQ